jgi:hypothetical protein
MGEGSQTQWIASGGPIAFQIHVVSPHHTTIPRLGNPPRTICAGKAFPANDQAQPPASRFHPPACLTGGSNAAHLSQPPSGSLKSTRTG